MLDASRSKAKRRGRAVRTRAFRKREPDQQCATRSVGAVRSHVERGNELGSLAADDDPEMDMGRGDDRIVWAGPRADFTFVVAVDVRIDFVEAA